MLYKPLAQTSPSVSTKQEKTTLIDQLTDTPDLSMILIPPDHIIFSTASLVVFKQLQEYVPLYDMLLLLQKALL